MIDPSREKKTNDLGCTEKGVTNIMKSCATHCQSSDSHFYVAFVTPRQVKCCPAQVS